MVSNNLNTQDHQHHWYFETHKQIFIKKQKTNVQLIWKYKTVINTDQCVLSKKRSLIYGSVYRSKKCSLVYGICVYVCCHENTVSFMEVCISQRNVVSFMVHVCCHKNAVSFMEVCIGQRNAVSFMVHVCICVVTKTLSRLWKCV